MARLGKGHSGKGGLPLAGTKIILGDELVCFGKLQNIRNQLCPAAV